MIAPTGGLVDDPLFADWNETDRRMFLRWRALNYACCIAFAHLPVGAFTNVMTAPKALEIGVMESLTQRIIREEAEEEARREKAGEAGLYEVQLQAANDACLTGTGAYKVHYDDKGVPIYTRVDPFLAPISDVA
jgi:hypothetical protein